MSTNEFILPDRLLDPSRPSLEANLGGRELKGNLTAELEGIPAPVAGLLVVADAVSGSHADPLRDLAVLLPLLREGPLQTKILMRRLRENELDHTS